MLTWGDDEISCILISCILPGRVGARSDPANLIGDGSAPRDQDGTTRPAEAARPARPRAGVNRLGASPRARGREVRYARRRRIDGRGRAWPATGSRLSRATA